MTGCTVDLGQAGLPPVDAGGTKGADVGVPIPRFRIAASGSVALFLIVYGVLNLRQIGTFLGEVGSFLTKLRQYILGDGGKPKDS